MDKKHRSPSYPPISLREAVERVETLYRSIGSHPAPREVIAKGLGYSGISGASATAIGALNKYGLLDGRGDDVRVSDRAMAILHPHSPEERRVALRDAAMEPDLFREIAERFHGGQVNDDLLRNYLLRNKFLPQAVEAAISAYKETIEFVGPAAGGYDSASKQPEAGASQMIQSTPSTTVHTAQAVVPPSGSERKLGRWDFEGGGYVEIRATPGVSTEDALDMAQTLIDLRRKELARMKRDVAPTGSESGE